MTEKFSTAMYMDRGAEQLVEILNYYISAIVESKYSWGLLDSSQTVCICTVTYHYPYSPGSPQTHTHTHRHRHKYTHIGTHTNTHTHTCLLLIRGLFVFVNLTQARVIWEEGTLKTKNKTNKQTNKNPPSSELERWLSS